MHKEALWVHIGFLLETLCCALMLLH